jgi:ADP-heptose:LPS heptosyltransferase
MLKKRVLIYRLGSLGDTVMVLPAFHLVREAFPTVPLSLLTNVAVSDKAAPVADILGPACPFEEVIAYPAGTRSVNALAALVLSLRRRRFSHCVYLAKPKGGLANLCRDWALFKMAGIPEVIGIPWTRKDRLCLPIPGSDLVEWDCARTMRCLRGLGASDLAEGKWWDLKLTAGESAEADIKLQGVSNRPLVGFSIGTKASSKDWEDRNWVPFLREFSRRYPTFHGLFIGSPDERERCDRLMRESGLAGINLCGQLSPRASAAALAKARLFVGHDSGPMHLAACVGTPVVAIFSARNRAGEWYPRGGAEANRIIYHRTECAGCGLVDCIAEQKKCILSITVDEVLEACEAVVCKT